MSSWLKELGYDLKHLVPLIDFKGKIHSTSDMHGDDMPTTSLDQLIMSTSAFECAFKRDAVNFVRMSTVSRSRIGVRETCDSDWAVGRTLAPLANVFGRGVILSVRSGRVAVSVAESANVALTLLATTLLNNSHAVGYRYTVHGRDTHYFVRPRLEQAADDIRELTLRPEGIVQGVNVTVHRHRPAAGDGSDVVRYIDVRLHGPHTAVNIRYGATVTQERDRVARHAKARATDSAWTIERELVQSGKRTINNWSKSQTEELLSRGQIGGVRAEYLRNVDVYPEIADDPRNIRFVPITDT